MVIAALAFLSAALAAAGLFMAAGAGDSRRAHGAGPVSGGGRGWRAPGVVRLLSAAGRRILPSATARAPRDLAARLAAAGLSEPTGMRARELMAAKLAATLACGGAGATLGTAAPGRLGVAITLAAPVAGFLGPDLWLARRAAERARRVRRELPSLLDLLRVTVEAGASLPAALEAVGSRTQGPLAREWRAVGREAGLGVPLAKALEDMTARLPLPEVRALVAALERARRHGSPLAEALAAQARDARFARRRRIQEEAARAGPKIQLAVALLLVPSVLLLVAAGLAAALLDSGGSFLPV